MLVFAERLKELRKSKGLSQRDLAMILNTTNSSVCDWERDRAEPNLKTIVELSELLECSCDYLLGKEEF